MKANQIIIPRGNKILIRADFKISTLNILNEEIINKTTPESYTIVSCSKDIKDLKPGDEVLLERGYTPMLIDFPWNDQSLRAKQSIHTSGKSIVGASTIKFSEYLLVDDFAIVGQFIDKNQNTDINAFS